MESGRFAGFLFFSAFATCIPARAQITAPAPGTIQSQAAEVVVDAVVTDRHNRIVPNLRAEDFTIYEDGIRQQVASFRKHAVSVTASTSGTETASSPEAVQRIAGGPAAEPPTLTVLLLDYSTTEFQNQKIVRDAAMKYVQDKLQPNEMLAVFTLGTSLRFLTDFTSDHDILLAALKSGSAQGSAIAADRADLTEEIERAQATNVPMGMRQDSVTPPAAGSRGGPTVGSGLSSLLEAAAIRRIARQYAALRSTIDREQTREILLAIRAIALGVKEVPGRKNLLLFSQGFVIPQLLWPQLQSVVDAANRAQLAIYSIDSHGLQTRTLGTGAVNRDEFTATLGPSENERQPLSQQERINAAGGETIFDRAAQTGHDRPETALRYLSGATGGFLIHNTNDLGSAMVRIREDTRSYYVLTYHPANQNWDGKFRQIRVDVRDPKLSVRARRGYYAIPTGYETIPPDDYAVIGQWHATDPQTPLYLRAGAFREPNRGYRVPVIVEIPTTGRELRVKIVGLVRDAQSVIVTVFGGPVQLNATATGSVSFVNTMYLPGGSSYSFEVFVKDLLSGNVSHAESGLYLREPTPDFSLSTVLLAGEMQKASRPEAQFLTVNGVKILPSARCEFHNGDSLIFYFDIYNPQLQPDKKTDLEVDASVLEGAQRGPLSVPAYRVTESVSDTPAHVTVARYVKLAGLTAGDYSLVVNVHDAVAGKSQSAHAAFHVVD